MLPSRLLATNAGEIPPVATVAAYRKMPVSGLQIMSYVYSMSPFKIEFDLTDDDFLD